MSMETTGMKPRMKTESPMRSSLEHLKKHIKYPANKKALVEACNNMSDASDGDRAWFTANIPEGNYKGPNDVLNALLTKV
jgi:hypothetical protein